ncbi:lipoprotein LpqH [Mycobacterium bourgelatii]|uniref:Lipoprotein n=1 Tax=Mycobacterium bourgelatii TaxID=1273442 RepID=A0A7I9YJ63_MYCBU|nr:lipoprotein LpqH [Mycobacterium bourgelatii]MCV6975472.1 lipoprotein LpqH [Mycobacterium bourgelatii]GFG88659.1 lipoprotein [Mycobacterium bourgelatii]
MKRELVIGVGAVSLMAGMAGCSGGEKGATTSSNTPTTVVASATTSSASATITPAAAGETRVLIGGQPLNTAGPVVCTGYEGRFSIQIGDPITGVIVGLEQDGSAVHNAGFGNVDGIVLSFTDGAPGNSATATKNGDSYRLTGTATGVDSAGQLVTKPFEVDVTCP